MCYMSYKLICLARESHNSSFSSLNQLHISPRRIYSFPIAKNCNSDNSQLMKEGLEYRAHKKGFASL